MIKFNQKLVMSHTLTKYQFMVTGEYSDRNFPAKNEKKKKKDTGKLNLINFQTH